MARDYTITGLIFARIKNPEAAIESFYNGLRILKELKENTGYDHPLKDSIQGYISELQK